MYWIDHSRLRSTAAAIAVIVLSGCLAGPDAAGGQDPAPPEKQTSEWGKGDLGLKLRISAGIIRQKKAPHLSR